MEREFLFICHKLKEVGIRFSFDKGKDIVVSHHNKKEEWRIEKLVPLAHGHNACWARYMESFHFSFSLSSCIIVVLFYYYKILRRFQLLVTVHSGNAYYSATLGHWNCIASYGLQFANEVSISLTDWKHYEDFICLIKCFHIVDLLVSHTSDWKAVGANFE